MSHVMQTYPDCRREITASVKAPVFACGGPLDNQRLELEIPFGTESLPDTFQIVQPNDAGELRQGVYCRAPFGALYVWDGWK